MKRLIAAAIFLAALCVSAPAQWNGCQPGLCAPATGAAPAYVGPGDIAGLAAASPKEFYSCRAYSLAKAGTKAYRIINETTTTQTDINSLANGLCDTTTPAVFCLGATCKVVTYYDQIGTINCSGSIPCDITQATDANRPVLNLTALNSWPCATNSASGGAVALVSAGILGGYSQPFTTGVLAERAGDFTTLQITLDAGNNQILNRFQSTANTVGLSAGGTTITATAADSAFHALIGVVNGASSSLVVDGSATTGNPGANNFNASIIAMNTQSANLSLNGTFCEAIIFATGLSATNYGLLNANIHNSTSGWNF